MPKSLKDCLLKLADGNKALSETINAAATDADLKALVDAFSMTSRENLQGAQLHASIMADHLVRLDAHSKEKIFKGDKSYWFDSSEAEDYLSRELSGTGSSLEREMEYIAGEAHAQWTDAMEEFRPASLRNVKEAWNGRSSSHAMQEDMIRGIFGEKVTDPKTQSIIDGWRKVAEDLRIKANKAGIPLKKISDFNVPTFHDSPALIKKGREAWKESIKRNFNMKRLNKLQGRLPNDSPDVGLDLMYDTLSTEGMSKISPVRVMVSERLGIRGQKQRVLFANDGDSYLNYHKEFGTDDYFNAMTGYIEGMSRTIAVARKFGPYADGAFDSLLKTVHVKTGKKPKGRLQAMYDDLTGALYSEETPMGNFFNSLRAVQTGSKLGFAQVSALSDTVFSARAASMNNMKVLKNFTGMLKRLQPVANKADRIVANRLLLGAEYALGKTRSMSRFSDITGNGAATKYANSVMRLSGLDYWTKTAKMSFGLEMLGNLGDFSRKGWDKLPSGMKQQLERYKVTPEDWGKLQESQLYSQEGARYLDPSNLDTDLSRKIVGMVREETRFAVPEANASTRAWMHWGLPKNTLGGEIARTVTQFKAFSISVLASQAHRALYQHTFMGAVKYFGITAGMTTVLGYAVLAAKDVLKGKTPRELNAKSIQDAIVQGGVTGLVGDFVLNTPAYAPLRAVVGPVFSDAETLHKFVFGSKKDVDDIESYIIDRAGRVGITVSKATIGNLWYTRLVVDRAINDGIGELSDPNWKRKQQRMEKRINTQYGQEMWGPRR